MLGKKKSKEKQPENKDGQMFEQILEVVQGVANKQQELDERMQDIEDHGAAGKAKLLAVEYAYRTPDEHMLELSRIAMTMVDPMVTDITIDALLDPRVLSGEMSIGEVERLAYLKIMRSVGGEHLKKLRDTAEEQEASEGEKGAEYDLGRE